ncbi:MAG: hypothetical protein U0Z44_09520 [Kouleothrix sp.]
MKKMKKPIISSTGSRMVKIFSRPPQAGAGCTITFTVAGSTPDLTSRSVMLSVDSAASDSAASGCLSASGRCRYFRRLRLDPVDLAGLRQRDHLGDTLFVRRVLLVVEVVEE